MLPRVKFEFEWLELPQHICVLINFHVKPNFGWVKVRLSWGFMDNGYVSLETFLNLLAIILPPVKVTMHTTEFGKVFLAGTVEVSLH